MSAGSRIAVGYCAMALSLVLLASCSAIYRTHGHAPSDFELEDVIVGIDTQESLEGTIGRPGSTGVLQDSDWYYVQSRWRHYGWKAPEETEREVVAIRFDEEGVVENVERFGLQDGRAVVLSRRVTDSNIRGIGFLRQLLGNIGNISAEQVFGE